MRYFVQYIQIMWVKSNVVMKGCENRDSISQTPQQFLSCLSYVDRRLLN